MILPNQPDLTSEEGTRGRFARVWVSLTAQQSLFQGLVAPCEFGGTIIPHVNHICKHTWCTSYAT